ncbi:MAG: hypothetical protein OJF49_004566 [Ktedonobacterales bacterium]|jgi:acetyltransferase-like isoleucine patch superfamily enzyme|nr:MAG: hypothetical protein OJF49_004566 [Ktedonobacterales bacterium]
MLGKVRQLWKKLLIRRLRRAGMRISPDCRIIGRRTVWGSEPYLIEIGKHVTISNDCIFVTHDGGTWVFRDRPEFRGVARFGTIRILDNCFIGARTIILPGVTIGPNAVVGAGSVVRKDVPPGEVHAGNPARFITTVEDYAERSRERSPHLDWHGSEKRKRAMLEATFWGKG